MGRDRSNPEISLKGGLERNTTSIEERETDPWVGEKNSTHRSDQGWRLSPQNFQGSQLTFFENGIEKRKSYHSADTKFCWVANKLLQKHLFKIGKLRQ
jgi:hypothetical protein